MKKSGFCALFTAGLVLLGSCSQGKGAAPSAQDSALQSAMIDDIVSDAAEQSGSGAYDLDLTLMSGTMVYATVYNILTEPESYLGKSIKLSGYFDTTYDESLDTRYYFVVIPDATACCTQGMEFIKQGFSYPDDFPAAGKDIEITGKIDRYDELGKTYYYIDADGLKTLQ